MIQFLSVKKKIVRISLLVFLAILVIVLVAIPLVVPPFVEKTVRERLADHGFKTDVNMRFGYGWRSGPALIGSLDASVRESNWRVYSDFAVSFSEVTATIHMPETTFSQDDPVIGRLLWQYPLEDVTNLTCSGSVALNASVTASPFNLTPRWKVCVPIRDLMVSVMTDKDTLTLNSLSTTANASGIGDHLDVTPLRVRADALSTKNLAFDNMRANLVVIDKTVMLTEGMAGFCGGTASLYALRLDLDKLNAGFTLLLDDIEAGEALARLRGFRGSATGRLHGKVRLFTRQGGKTLHLREAFLYSVPGETGKINLKNPEEFGENLALAGLDEATGSNLACALTDLDYSVLRLNLTHGENGDATLSTRIAGTARRGDLSVPVDVTINLHGELEQLINKGLSYTKRMNKGKHK